MTTWPSAFKCAVAPIAVLFAVACGGGSATAPSSTNSVLRQGTLTMSQTDTASVESGTLHVGLSAADIWFEADSVDERFLSPVNGTLAVAGTQAPSVTKCRATTAKARIPIQTLTPGLYLCGTTLHAHVAVIRLDQLPGPYVVGSPVPTLSLTFTTYY